MLFLGIAILGTHFRTILGAGLFSGLVILLVFTEGFCSFLLRDATTSLISFASFFSDSSFFLALPYLRDDEEEYI
jgi:hypothetical protein